MTNFSETTEAEIEVVSNSEEIYTALLTPPGESEDHYQELKPTGKTIRIKDCRFLQCQNEPISIEFP